MRVCCNTEPPSLTRMLGSKKLSFLSLLMGLDSMMEKEWMRYWSMEQTPEKASCHWMSLVPGKWVRAKGPAI